jgi:pyruvate/2-oxoacid:ferredoxin oxidoreductase alpha subunit
MCVANRAMAAPWNVLNDQQDSMSVRDVGWVQLYCRDNQEICDTTVQAFRIAERLNVPVMVCYDGFLLSHTMMPVDVPEPAEVDAFLPPRSAPLQIVDVNEPRNVGPVTLADPRTDAEGVLQPGYMELRAMHHGALLEALDVVPDVDAAWATATGRAWGGLLSEYLLDDAEVVLVAAGSLVTQLTLVAETLRAEGVRAGVLGIRCYRPFPATALRERLTGRKLALVFDKALSYGCEGPIAADLKAALQPVAEAPAVFGAICGLGGRDVSPAQLAEATRAAIADLKAGVRDRAPHWINLAEGSMR